MPRVVDDNCLDLVRRFEGLRTEAYRCPAGLWTIDYGHTGDVQPGQRITARRAEQLLRDDLAACAAQVQELVWVPLLDGRFGAGVSFVFNAGVGSRRAAAGELWLSDSVDDAFRVGGDMPQRGRRTRRVPPVR